MYTSELWRKVIWVGQPNLYSAIHFQPQFTTWSHWEILILLTKRSYLHIRSKESSSSGTSSIFSSYFGINSVILDGVINFLRGPLFLLTGVEVKISLFESSGWSLMLKFRLNRWLKRKRKIFNLGNTRSGTI